MIVEEQELVEVKIVLELIEAHSIDIVAISKRYSKYRRFIEISLPVDLRYQKIFLKTLMNIWTPL
jgi:hypothetical protein